MTIEITDPIDENKLNIEYTNYLKVGDTIFVKTEFSNCILELEIIDNGKLKKVESGEIIGRII